MEQQLEQALKEARMFAMRSPGYLSGETLIDMQDSHHSLVISTWRAREEWEAWDGSNARRRVRALIEPLLEVPETVTIYEVTLHNEPQQR
jgi:heme-degrading monooxygenase HmoA